MRTPNQEAKVSVLLCLSVAIITCLVSSTYFGVANSQQNNALIQPQGVQGMSSNGTNYIGTWRMG
jgi:hypothetical protein